MNTFIIISLQLMSAIKTGAMANIRLELALNKWERKQIPTDRSGGGV